MARTSYDKEDGTEENTSQEKKKESSPNIETIYTTTPYLDEYNQPQEQHDDISNSILVDEAPLKDSYTHDSYSPDYPNFIPQQVYPLADIYRMFLPPQQTAFIPPIRSYTPYVDHHSDDNLDSDEVVLDPDNFEYFKGVSILM